LKATTAAAVRRHGQLNMLPSFGVLVLLLLAGRSSLPAQGATHTFGDPDPMGGALVAARMAVRPGLSSAEASDLDAAYQQHNGAPLWLDADRQLTRQAPVAMSLLEEAASEGLDPADYRVADLTALAAVVDRGTAASTAARFDALLTASVLRYFRHVHMGRVDPRTMGLQLQVPEDGHDFPRLLHSALVSDHLRATAAGLAPPLWQYQALKAALPRAREIAARAPAPPSFPGPVRPGDIVPKDTLEALHALLISLGDLPGMPLPDDGRYDAALEAGVLRFQQRHGLEPDGIIGKATQAALAIPLSWRVRQIELALERLRWLPDLAGERLIAVNIPMFRLWVWDAIPSSQPPALSMNVIVGRALDTRTPVFAGEMTHVIFRPYWNVPTSILRNELLPAIRRDPAYLARQNLEIVAGPSDSSPVLPPSSENIARIGQGGVRLRQRPGPRNALGLIKFMFPNQNDVYMHGTPSPQLFAAARRDFSHGCIRVADPTALAEWVLRDDPAWSRDRLVQAMEGPSNRRVDLPQPIQVIIFYTTAVVQPEDGLVHYADDVYGHDRRLDKAL
jgi:murein L,D-transpeptidase YcbB/YkuD